ncbi:hypothetical protein [Streptomyces sp. RB17]|uniref:hypothetical protein n=1 Tax=Streptomyces sp. RB17 TaxID=2585197 RepID=UPI001E5AEA40|nr:hypothetical protein [Streptomyces sp. RB17]
MIFPAISSSPTKKPAKSLWPRTLIDTAAVRNVIGGAERARTPQIVADAAHAILTRAADECTGNLFIDDEVLAAEGVRDLSTSSPRPASSRSTSPVRRSVSLAPATPHEAWPATAARPARRGLRPDRTGRIAKGHRYGARALVPLPQVCRNRDERISPPPFCPR